MLLTTLILISALLPAQDERFDRALAEMQKGRYAEAILELDEILAGDSKNAAALEWRGHCRHSLEESELALADFNAALALDPARPRSHCARGMVLRELGEPLEAIASYTRAIALEPRFLEALNWRGLTLAETGQTAAAIVDFTTSIEIEPRDAWVFYKRAESRIVLRDFVEAGVDFVAALKLRPEDAGLRARLGVLMAVAGDPRSVEILLAAQKQDHAVDGLPLWVWLARREAGHPAKDVDGELKGWTYFSSDRSWSLCVGSYLTGGLTAEELPAAVIDAEQSRAEESLGAEALDCRVAFFRGVGHHLNGRVQAAIDDYVACLNTFSPELEWEGARLRLRKLAEEHKIAPAPGFKTAPTAPEFCAAQGLDPQNSRTVSELDPIGLAARSGLQRGDVLLELNAAPLTVESLGTDLSKKLPGDYLPLLVLRGTERVNVTVLLGLAR